MSELKYSLAPTTTDPSALTPVAVGEVAARDHAQVLQARGGRPAEGLAAPVCKLPIADDDLPIGADALGGQRRTPGQKPWVGENRGGRGRAQAGHRPGSEGKRI
jgi:hypothetical protein